MISEAMSRRAAIGLLALIVPMPLQWQSLGHGPLGTVRYFHVGAIVMLIIARPTKQAMFAVLDKVRPLPASSVLVTICAVIAAIFWHGNKIAPVQVFIYIAIGLVGGATLILAIAHESGRRLLALAGPATLVLLLVMFQIAVHRAGINVAKAFSQALVLGDTNSLEFGLYRAAFRTTDPAARDNLRHEVVAALMVATYLSMAVSAYARKFRVLNAATALIVFGIVTVSLSRSVMIAMVIPMVLALIKVLIRPKMPVWGFLGLVILLGTSPLLIGKFGRLIGARFADTGSLNGRVSNLTAPSFGEVVRRGIAGGKTLAMSTHMWVIDSFLNGSLIAGLAALVCVFVMVRLAVQACVLYFQVGGVYYYSIMAAAVLTITRAFTTGGGNIYEGEWFAIGMAAALLWLVRNLPLEAGPPTFENAPVPTVEPTEPVEPVEPTRSAPTTTPQRPARSLVSSATRV